MVFFLSAITINIVDRSWDSCAVNRGRVPWMQKLKAPLVGTQGYQRFPLSKFVVSPDVCYPQYMILSMYVISTQS